MAVVPVRVLVACEFSGIVRDAFIAAGHEAISIDLLPSERPGPHLQGDVSEWLLDIRWGRWPQAWGGPAGFDLLIAHPPCTYLALSGVRWLYGGKGTVRDPERWALMEKAADFFRLLYEADFPRIAVENPIQHRHGGLPRPTQIVQPWMFGHGETKATGWWLKNLPPLVPTNIVPEREQRVHKMGPGPERWRERSRTFPGMAQAMAEQWGSPHDLRGTSATILRQLGVSEDTRMARLGHSTTAMSRHYGQAHETQDREAVDRLAEAIG